MTTEGSNAFQYDVVFSLAGEDLDYVTKVAEYISKRGIKLWFYKNKEAEIWGENGIDTFHKIFTQSAKYCVLFVSKQYVEKVWPNLERQFIQSRWLKDNHYLLPARFDNSKLEGLPDTINYVNLTTKTPEEFGNLIIEKVAAQQTTSDQQLRNSTLPLPKVNKSFNPYEERDTWINYLNKELKTAGKSDPDMIIHSEIDTDGLKVRVMYKDKTVYSINIYRNGFSNEKGLSFYGDQGEIQFRNSAINAWGTFAWSKEKNEVVLNMVDMSFLDYANQEKVITVIESQF
jgi:hypothetical protein